MDFITDQSCRYLAKLHGSLADVPDYVKVASVDPADTAALNRNQFADPANREFPIDEAGHVFLSYGYLKAAGISRPDVETKILRAAELLGITADLARVGEVEFNVKSASAPEAEYAVSIDFTGHTKQAGVQHFYPVNSRQEVIDSSVQLCNDRSKFPIEVFVEGCKNIVKAASVHGCADREIPAVVREYGAERFVDYDHVQFQAARRTELTGDEIYAEISKSAAEDLDRSVDEYIELWRRADRQNGVDGKPGVKEAHLVFYSGTDKAAFDKAAEDWIVLGGAAVPKQALAKVPDQDLKKLFPADLAGQLTSLVKRAKSESSNMLHETCKSLAPAVQQSMLKLVLKHA